MNRIGDYNLIERIGAGGMGEVWRAENVHTHVPCAVKLLPEAATADRNFVSRFFDEGRVMQTLEHPNIVRVHHVGHDEKTGRYYLVEDLIEQKDAKGAEKSVSLHDLLAGAEHHRLSEEDVQRWAMQVADALAYAHANGVIHRDIKPANVLIDRDGNARVTDFGLAKAIGEEYVQSQIHQSIAQSMGGRATHAPAPAPGRSLGERKTLQPDTRHATPDTSHHRTTADALLGTYDYMSPEQRGELPGVEVAPPSDIWSFGVMLYRMLTGQRPAGMAKPVTQVVRGVSKKWDRICARCLDTRPENRYADGAALRAALGSGVDIGVRGRWVKAAVLAAAAVVFVGVSYTSYKTHRSYGTNGTGEGPPLPAQTPAKPIPPAPSTPQRMSPAVQPAVPQAPEPLELEPGGIRVGLDISPPGGRVVLTRQGRPVLRVEQVSAAGTNLMLAAGTYTLMASKSGYQPLNVKVEVDAATETLSYRLSEITGVLQIRSDSGVEVSAVPGGGGEAIEIGTTDSRGQLSYGGLLVGEYRIRLSKTDYGDEEVEVELKEGRPVTVDRLLTGLPGRLEVFSGHEVEVLEGKEKVGTSAKVIRGLAAGKHALELRRKGYRTVRRTVKIPPNGYASVQVDNLVEESGTLRVVAEVPDYAREYFEDAKKELRIGTGGWEVVGKLPCEKSELACEETGVDLKVAGFVTANGHQSTRIEDGKTATVAFKLTPEPAEVTVTCNAPDATVTVEGRESDAGHPLSLPSLKTLTLTVTAPKHKSRELLLEPLEPGKKDRRQVVLKELRGPEPGRPWTVPNLGMAFVPVASGKFIMGSPRTETDRDDDETQHSVTLAHHFWLGKYEVTQAEYEALTGKSPSHFKGARNPVETVSWDDAAAFCAKLTEREDKAGRLPQGYEYRLPTEAEWEYVARGGARIKGFTYSGSDTPGDVAWYGENSGSTTHPVGGKDPNELGLHDMSGNVWEWCLDWYDEVYYEKTDGVSDPVNLQETSYRVLRGGSWNDSVRCVRSAYRDRIRPSGTFIDLGFRVCLAREVR